MQKIKVVYEGTYEAFEIDGLIIKRGEPVDVSKQFYEERKRIEPGAWRLVRDKAQSGDIPSKKGGEK